MRLTRKFEVTLKILREDEKKREKEEVAAKKVEREAKKVQAMAEKATQQAIPCSVFNTLFL